MEHTNKEETKPSREIVINGVDLVALKETINAIQAKPELAAFQFRNRNQWLNAGHNRSTIKSFYGVCQEDTTRKKPFIMEADEPPVLLSKDQGANPVEYVLHALAACMTTSIAYHAAARGIRVEKMQSRLEGDIDLQGFLGLDENVSKGYQKICVHFEIETDGTESQLRECMCFSPVYSMISKALPVEVSFDLKK